MANGKHTASLINWCSVWETLLTQGTGLAIGQLGPVVSSLVEVGPFVVGHPSLFHMQPERLSCRPVQRFLVLELKTSVRKLSLGTASGSFPRAIEGGRSRICLEVFEKGFGPAPRHLANRLLVHL